MSRYSINMNNESLFIVTQHIMMESRYWCFLDDCKACNYNTSYVVCVAYTCINIIMNSSWSYFHVDSAKTVFRYYHNWCSPLTYCCELTYDCLIKNVYVFLENNIRYSILTKLETNFVIIAQQWDVILS